MSTKKYFNKSVKCLMVLKSLLDIILKRFFSNEKLSVEDVTSLFMNGYDNF